MLRNKCTTHRSQWNPSLFGECDDKQKATATTSDGGDL